MLFRSDQRHLGQGQLAEVLLEVAAGGGGDAVGARAEVDLVEVQRQDRLLRVPGLEAAGHDRLAGLARDRLVGAEELLGDLLRDRAAALLEVAGGEVGPGRARDALVVDAAVAEEVVAEPVVAAEEAAPAVEEAAPAAEEAAPAAEEKTEEA